VLRERATAWQQLESVHLHPVIALWTHLPELTWQESWVQAIPSSQETDLRTHLYPFGPSTHVAVSQTCFGVHVLWHSVDFGGGQLTFPLLLVNETIWQDLVFSL
jgi:hypothetical protein